jgi:hypothetical protein
MLEELIKGIGTLSELWMITFQSFKNQKMSDEDALMHTKAMMSIMVESFYGSGGKQGGK